MARSFISASPENCEDYLVGEIYSVGYRAPEQTGRIPTPIWRALLIENNGIKVGGWGISDDSSLAIFTARIAADATVEELRAAILAVIRTSDEMEEKLTSKDNL